MGKQLFARKRGFKRPNKSEVPMKGRKAKNQRTKDDKFNRDPSPSASEGSSEERETVATDEEAVIEEEQVVYREPTMYDNLLQKLGSGSDSIANALRRRQREEEGRSDTEEDEDEGSEPSHASEGEEDGSEGESTRSHDEENSSQRSEVGLVEQSESSGTGSENDGMSDTDEVHDQGAPGQSIAEASVSTSSFDKHLGYKLSQGEVDKLLRMKWSYKWEMPAVDMSSCKWKGTGECFMKESNVGEGYGLRPRLFEHWLKNFKDSGGSGFHSSKERLFFSLCNSYRDILHHNKKPFYIKGSEEDSRIADAYIMHSLNHIFRTRDLIKKNNEKLAKHQEHAKGDILNNDGFLDQGFTRPKVLILLPLASIAHRVVKRLIKLTPFNNKSNVRRPEASVENFNRFDDEFGAEDNEHEDDIENSKSKNSSKPSDFQALFGGNNNDHFMIGIKFTRGNIKLYNDFYSSDIIVASPLGLITKIGETEVLKEKDIDYLSSIEVLVIDHADVILMQNWSHVNTVVKHLNRIPSKQHGTDIMRIRQWYLDGQARFYRQTIILGSHLNPDINSLFNHHCFNYEGKVRLACQYKGVLPKVIVQTQQVYHRFDADSFADADDARLEYFSKKVFPKIKDSIQGGIMIFISSYFEFVRLRNFLKSQDASFCLLGEYTKQSDISSARVWFFQGQRKIMLYTERAHFYHRYKIRGIQNLIIYSLPERKEFYPEIVNMLEGSHSVTCTVLYSRFDQLRLERVVGSAAAKRMVTSENGVFVFEHK